MNIFCFVIYIIIIIVIIIIIIMIIIIIVIIIIVMLLHKNIERYTTYTMVSCPNLKQWLIVHTSDLMMTIRQHTYYLNHHKENE